MNRFIKKPDIFLILFFCAICAVMFLPRFIGSGDLTAVIYKHGEEIYRIDLTKVSSSYSIDLNSDPASAVKVEKGAIGYLHSDCPDKLCVNTGMLTRRGQTAACLPARTVIVLTGGKKDAGEPDVITY